MHSKKEIQDIKLLKNGKDVERYLEEYLSYKSFRNIEYRISLIDDLIKYSEEKKEFQNIICNKIDDFVKYVYYAQDMSSLLNIDNIHLCKDTFKLLNKDENVFSKDFNEDFDALDINNQEYLDTLTEMIEYVNNLHEDEDVESVKNLNELLENIFKDF